MADTDANQAYARYMLRWIEALDWPEFPLAEAELPALRSHWDDGDAADLDAVAARLWGWVDAHGGGQPGGDRRMILARMLICVAEPDNRELQERGYFEELLAAAGVAPERIQMQLPGARRAPWSGDGAATDAPAVALREGYQRLKTQVLMAFGAVSFVSGATLGHSQLEPLWISLMAFLIFLWYRLDSDQIGFRRTTGLTAAVILIAAIGVPWYLVQSRGWERGRVAILQAIGVFFASIALSSTGAMLFANLPA